MSFYHRKAGFIVKMRFLWYTKTLTKQRIRSNMDITNICSFKVVSLNK